MEHLPRSAQRNPNQQPASKGMVSCDVTADQSGVPIGPSSQGGTQSIPGPAPSLGLACTCAVAATFAAAPFCRGLNVRRSSGRSGYGRLQLSPRVPFSVSVSPRGEAWSEQSDWGAAAEGGDGRWEVGPGPCLRPRAGASPHAASGLGPTAPGSRAAGGSASREPPQLPPLPFQRLADWPRRRPALLRRPLIGRARASVRRGPQREPCSAPRPELAKPVRSLVWREAGAHHLGFAGLRPPSQWAWASGSSLAETFVLLGLNERVVEWGSPPRGAAASWVIWPLSYLVSP